MEDDDFFGGEVNEEEVRRKTVNTEEQTKIQQIDNLGYREGLVSSLEKAQQDAVRKGIIKGFEEEYQQAYNHGRIKAAEMLKHLE